MGYMYRLADGLVDGPQSAPQSAPQSEQGSGDAPMGYRDGLMIDGIAKYMGSTGDRGGTGGGADSGALTGGVLRSAGAAGTGSASAGGPRPTAALSILNPYCSCKLTNGPGGCRTNGTAPR